jgi:hypothetical protein
MADYVIQPAAGRVGLTGQVDDTPWARAGVARIDRFCWYKAGRQQLTEARVLYDGQGLYLQFIAQDAHIFSKTTELNGPVCTDSCVEFFATIAPAAGNDYFNFEVNCCGVIHLGFGPGREGRRLIGPDLAGGICVAASVPTLTKDESPDDDGWWLATAIPWDVLDRFAGKTVRPKAGTVWRGNFYRCGGKTDPQFACWSPVGTPGPDFHRPEFFGTLRFR